MKRKNLETAINFIDKWLNYTQRQEEIPSVSISIFDNREVLFKKSYGYADLEKKIKATDKTLYRIASISKSFTATAIMQLVENGKINLEDKVVSYLPWITSNDGDIAEVTIRQLLSHTSGIRRDFDSTYWEDDEFPAVNEIKDQFNKKVKIIENNISFKYSNFVYGVLGQLVEKVLKVPYEEYIRNNIFKKLKLEDTYVDFKDSVQEQLAQGYGRKIPGKVREEFRKDVETKGLASATGFVSNVDDLSKYFMTFLSDEDTSILTRESIKEMSRVQCWKSGNWEMYGLGFSIWDRNGEGALVGHGGGFAGYSSRVALDREKNIGVVVLTNTIFAHSHLIINACFDAFQFIEKNNVKSKDLNLSKYEGVFSSRWMDMIVVQIGDDLYGIDPSQSDIFEDSMQFKKLGKDKFKMVNGNKYNQVQEDIEFEFDKSKKIKGVKFGAIYLLPYENYLDGLEDSKR